MLDAIARRCSGCSKQTHGLKYLLSIYVIYLSGACLVNPLSKLVSSLCTLSFPAASTAVMPRQRQCSRWRRQAAEQAAQAAGRGGAASATTAGVPWRSHVDAARYTMRGNSISGRNNCVLVCLCDVGRTSCRGFISVRPGISDPTRAPIGPRQISFYE